MSAWWDPRFAGLAVALAVGLLIGLDREKHKTAADAADAAGIRTFTVVALLGAIAALSESTTVLAVIGAGVVVLDAATVLAFRRGRPGHTTAFALLATFAIGYLALEKTAIAAMLGALIALLLNSKSRLHNFAATQLSAQELNDGLLLAGAALIVSPLLPDRPVDPFGVVNLRLVWGLTILTLAVNALGYVARRMLGPGVGLAVAGFFGGFVSSILTIAALGRQARSQHGMLRSAVAGASFSSIATSIELLIVIGLANGAMLRPLAPGIIAMGLVATAYGVAFAAAARGTDGAAEPERGRAFEPRIAVVFAVSFAAMLLAAAALRRLLGSGGALATIAAGGFVDTHAAAASAVRLAAAGALDTSTAAVAALLAITANALVKAAAAIVAGSREYRLRVCPSHAAMIAALWGGWYLFGR